MRFIRGDSLKEAIERFHEGRAWARDLGRRSLELRKLLRRFLDVCNAVDYAHSRGVLHRDIKPGNVIVGKYGETLVVDWGLAKATGKAEPGAEERTLMPGSAGGSSETLPGSALGTPAYMSPEQAAGDPERLGPRSDVYSLGATLYCLLTGRPPLGGELFEALRKVQRGEFPPPREVDPSIDKALEAVCLKAMATRPEDRYASCRALADDVERWTADEPVSAYRDSLSRRALRWSRRHRTGVTAAAVAVLAGLIGLGAVAAVQTGARRDLASKNLDLEKANAATTKEKVRAEAALVAETKAKKATDEALRRAQGVLGFLQDDLLAEASPEKNPRDKKVTVEELLDRAAAGVAGRFDRTPLVEAAIRQTIGETYEALGRYQDALPHLERALVIRRRELGEAHPDSDRTGTRLASIYRMLGRYNDAEPMFVRLLEGHRRRLGTGHPQTLGLMNDLANLLTDQGRLAEAEPLYVQALEGFRRVAGANDPHALTTMNNLALLYRDQGKAARAEALMAECLERRRKGLGPEHPLTLVAMRVLAMIYQDQDKFAEAEPLAARCLEAQRRVVGPEHPDTLVAMNELASVYFRGGRYAEAEPLFVQNLEARRRDLGAEHPETLTALNNLAVLYRAQARYAAAEPLFVRCLEARRRVLGAEHPVTLQSLHNLATEYRDQSRHAEADRAYSELVAIYRRAPGGGRQRLGLPLTDWGTSLVEQARYAEAEPILREAMKVVEETYPDDWRRFHTTSLLGAAVAGRNRYAEAEPLLLQGYEGMEARRARISAPQKIRLTESAARVVRLYEAWGKPEQAAAWKAKLGMADLPEDVFARP
jgi:tetratricopeptide (TPR) repeat protein